MLYTSVIAPQILILFQLLEEKTALYYIVTKTVNLELENRVKH